MAGETDELMAVLWAVWMVEVMVVLLAVWMAGLMGDSV